MIFQRSRAIILTLLLLASDVASSGAPTVLGVVVDANRAHLSTNELSVGTTVYDGDALSTDSGGLLRLRSRAALLDVEEDSALVLRTAGNSAEGAEAQVRHGKIVFSAARATAMRIAALGAEVAPEADAPTIAEVSVKGPKELRIFARRSSVRISYDGDSEVIPEGEICRVLLDSGDNSAPDSKKELKKHPHTRLLIVILATGAGAAGAAYWATHSGSAVAPGSNVISPDKP